MQRLPQINFFLITIVLEDAVHSCIEQTLLTDGGLSLVWEWEPRRP